MAPKEAKKLAEWFDINYVRGEVKKVLKNGSIIRQPPRFSPKKWSVLDNHKNDMPRTSNNVEGWHRRWNAIVDVAHPSTFSLIGTLKSELIVNEGQIIRTLSGDPKPPQNIKNVQRQIKLATVIANKEDYSLENYVTALAHSMKL